MGLQLIPKYHNSLVKPRRIAFVATTLIQWARNLFEITSEQVRSLIKSHNMSKLSQGYFESDFGIRHINYQ